MEEELDYLRSVKRGEVAEKIKVARSFGDLSENAEYDEARKEQSFMEGRIQWHGKAPNKEELAAALAEIDKEGLE